MMDAISAIRGLTGSNDALVRLCNAKQTGTRRAAGAFWRKRRISPAEHVITSNHRSECEFCIGHMTV